VYRCCFPLPKHTVTIYFENPMETEIYIVIFPRYEEDVLTHKRTLFHLPLNTVNIPKLGSLTILIPEWFTNVLRASVVITHLSKVLLKDLPDEDLNLLAVESREDYFKRWEVLHMANPLENPQEVWRIQFNYVNWDDTIQMYVNRD
jgi:hypothetical protein